ATRSLPPRSGSIKQACSRYGIGRASLYAKAAGTPGLFREWGAKNLVDYEIMGKGFSELPPAESKLPLSKGRPRGCPEKRGGPRPPTRHASPTRLLSLTD